MRRLPGPLVRFISDLESCRGWPRVLNHRALTLGVGILISLSCSVSSRADLLLTGSGTSSDHGSPLQASADFSLSGTTLTVVLTNTESAAVVYPTDVLTGVLFNTSSATGHGLTPSSAALTSGSTVASGATPTSYTSVGEGWQYKTGISAHGENSGISAAGLGVFGPSGNFYSPGVNLDGLDYGLVGSGGISGSANTGVTGHGPLFQKSITFTLTVGSNFSLSDIGTQVVFQYGTALTDSNFSGSLVPEPSTMLIAAVGTLGFVGYGIGRRKKS